MTIAFERTTVALPRIPLGQGEIKTTTALTLHMGVREVISLTPDRRGGWRRQPLLVECVVGELWVTQEGDEADYFLRAGERFTSKGAGRLVVQAMEASAARICEAVPDHPLLRQPR